MNFEIEKETYKEIEELISSEASPVGIDAKKTHIIILSLLSRISERLDSIEKKISQ